MRAWFALSQPPNLPAARQADAALASFAAAEAARAPRGDPRAAMATSTILAARGDRAGALAALERAAAAAPGDEHVARALSDYHLHAGTAALDQGRVTLMLGLQPTRPASPSTPHPPSQHPPAHPTRQVTSPKRPCVTSALPGLTPAMHAPCTAWAWRRRQGATRSGRPFGAWFGVRCWGGRAGRTWRLRPALGSLSPTKYHLPPQVPAGHYGRPQVRGSVEQRGCARSCGRRRRAR